MNIKLSIEYEGTNYHGWQIQKPLKVKSEKLKVRTIQGEIEKVLGTILHQKIKLIGAARTDSGVHALGQVANCRLQIADCKLQNLQKSLNSILPNDIAVKKMEKVSENFHARYSAKSKIYLYQILNQERPSPFLRNVCWHIPMPLHWEKIKSAMKFFLGTHDFNSFSSTGSPRKTHSCTIKSFSVRPPVPLFPADKNNLYVIEIEADRFLYRMARYLVTYLVEVGRGRRTLNEVHRVLKAGYRPSFLAPPHGLFLWKVRY